MSDELALVNKVELRLLMTKEDKKFEEAVAIYLCPLLLKIDSQNEQVRTKVEEIFQHIFERVSHTESMKLPVDKVMQQFTDEKINSAGRITVQLYDLQVITHGIKSMNAEERSQYILPMIHVFGKLESPEVVARALYLFIELLKTYSPPGRGTAEADQLRYQYGFDEDPKLEEFFCHHFFNIFAYKFGQRFSGNDVSVQPIDILTNCNDLPMEQGMIYDAKKAVLRFLIAGGFSEQAAYLPLLILSHDANSDFASPARDRFRKIRVDLDDQKVIDKLYYVVESSQRVGQAAMCDAIEILCKSQKAVKMRSRFMIEKGLKNTAPGYICENATVTAVLSTLKFCPDDISLEFARQLVTVFKNNIVGMGWPEPLRWENKMILYRENAYKSIAKLINKKPQVLDDELRDLIFLFDAMKGDKMLKVGLQDALSEVLVIVPQLPAAQRDKIKQMTFDSLIDVDLDQSCKFVFVRYAARIASFGDAEGRMLCLLGVHEENRSDVIEEARRGLHPHWHWLVNSLVYEETPTATSFPFPKFEQMLDVVSACEKQLESKQLAKNLLDFSPSVFAAAVKFLEQTLAMEAAVEAGNKAITVIDESWDSRLDAAIAMDKDVRSAVRSLINKYATEGKAEVLTSFISYTFKGVKNTNFKEVNDVWVRTISQSPPSVVESQIGCVDELVPLLDVNNTNTRDTAAQGLGILATTDQSPNVDQLINSLYEKIDVNDRLRVDKSCGRILALGYIVSRLALRGKSSNYPVIIAKITELVGSTISENINNAAIDAVFQLGISGALTPTDELREKLVKCAKRESERAILALGALSMGESDRKQAIDEIMGLADSRQVEFIFASGEAMTIAACGWESTVTDRVLDIQGIHPSTANTQLDHALEATIESCKSARPKVRKFGCLWLLSLMQYCGHLPAIRNNLKRIHTSFMNFLSSDDDIMQESASRGLGIIYEMGDDNLKSELVRGLVQSMTGERKVNAGTVSEDTELFAPGVLDTGDGSVSTYKDILNLASEVGDPSLVYKFMSLAAHSSLWASRRGAAFGLGSIISKANMDEVFAANTNLSNKLIPKLYRYRFDPNTNVRQSMRGIWDTLISDKTAAVKDNFDLILVELLKSMMDREWRVREASVNALLDLLQGQKVERYQDRLEEIWKLTFKRVDDIKDSVRKAGMVLARGLTTSMVRHVDVDSGASAKLADTILKEMLPFLLGINGLQSDAEEVSSFALDALLKLCKKGGKALRPHIPMLIEELLNLMTILEPQAMNYLSMNADKYGLTSNDIDTSRLNSLRGSPVLEAVEQMIELLDDRGMMKDVAERIAKVIKKSVGLPSKLGASRVLGVLVMRRMQEIAPHADMLLKACRSQLTNMNPTVAQTFAYTAGYMCRVATNEAVVEYEKSLEPLYFDSEDEKPKLVAGVACKAVGTLANDKFDAVASSFLPLIFVAKHDDDKQVAEKFGESWNDNTGGSGAIKLHLQEISKLCSEQLANNQQWKMRQVAASSIADASTVIDVNTNDLHQLFDVLLVACKGKSWSGKDKVLDALVKLAIRAKAKVVEDQELFDKISSLVMAEAKRRNRAYQSKALLSLGQFTKEFPQPKLYEALFEHSEGYLNPEAEHDGSDDELDEDGDVTIANSAASIAKEDQRNEILKAVVGSYVAKDVNQNQVPEDVLQKMCQLVVTILSSESNPKAQIPVTWRTKVASLSALSTLTGQVVNGQFHQLELAWKTVMTHCARDLNHERVRTEAVRLGAAIRAKGLDTSADLQALKTEEKSAVVMSELNKALK